MNMSSVGVWIFFHGTFMSRDVLIDHGVTPASVIPGKLYGFEFDIRPRVNITPADGSCVHGAIVSITHEEIVKLYSTLEEKWGVNYLPHSVITESFDGTLRPALCHIASNMNARAAEQVYVTQLAECARQAGHPDWYVELIESFGTQWAKV